MCIGRHSPWDAQHGLTKSKEIKKTQCGLRMSTAKYGGGKQRVHASDPSHPLSLEASQQSPFVDACESWGVNAHL